MTRQIKRLPVLGIALVAILLTGCSGEPASSPEPTNTSTPVRVVPTPAQTATSTAVPSLIPTATPTPAQIATSTPVPAPVLESAPPTWIFAGDIPEEDQAILREEMEYSRSYFNNRFGIEATGFTVLVGASYEALSSLYPDVVGIPLSAHYHPEAGFTYAWVTSSATGGSVMVLIYGTLRTDSLVSLKHHIAHEYFHVLQGQLVTGFSQLQDGEIAWHNDTSVRGPFWLVEGLASYADYAYTPSRADRLAFDFRYKPYGELTWFHLEGSAASGDLKKMGDLQNLLCAFPGPYAYALSFVASLFLVEQAGEDSYVEYWRLVGERPTWQQAFEEAFGIGVNDFYRSFEEWLPSQLLSEAQLKLQMRWPDMETGPQSWEFLYIEIDPTFQDPPEIVSYGSGWTGLSGLPLYMIVSYPAGLVGAGPVSLWWSDDQCTEHLLGWHKDGELTDRREDATAVELTGQSAIIDWNIPGHPDTLPHLEERKRIGCR